MGNQLSLKAALLFYGVLVLCLWHNVDCVRSKRRSRHTTKKVKLSVRDSTDSKNRVTKDDLLVSLHTSHNRLKLIKASRVWRRGIRTVITSDQALTPHNSPPGLLEGHSQHKETWHGFRNINDSGLHLGYKPGDLRAAVAPFLANVTVGVHSYKWILYGDDDTVFNVNNVLKLVNTLDHNVPYLLSDCLWYPENSTGSIKLHPNREAPRCLPCNYQDPLLSGNSCLRAFNDTQSGMQFNAVPACPCTPNVLCQHDQWGVFNKDECGKAGAEFKHDPAAATNPHVGWWYMIHGGAGALISVGLMQKMRYDDVLKYYASVPMQSGDALVTKVIWFVGGIAPTDPGYGFCRPHIQMFDPGFRGYRARGLEDLYTGDSGADPTGVMARYELALANRCDAICEDQLRHLISVHVRCKYAAVDWLGVAPDRLDPIDESPNFRAGVFLIRKLGVLFDRYARKSDMDAAWGHE